jgi:NADPH:quinone reductase-like Zn-dependent oxidoreductase
VRIAQLFSFIHSFNQSISVNPSDVDLVEGGLCAKGCGVDVAGLVVACPGCTTIKVGDEVWGMGSNSFAEFEAISETKLSLKPPSLTFREAATIPEVGSTSLLCLKRTVTKPGTPFPKGSPWNKENLTIVITEGSGGTGSMGIELAKAYGATNIWVSATGKDGIAFVKSLGMALRLRV